MGRSAFTACLLQGSLQPPPVARAGGFLPGGRGAGRGGFDPAFAAAAAAGPFGPYGASGRGGGVGGGRGGAFWGPEAYMGYYAPMGPGAHCYAAAAAAAATAPPAMVYPRGRGGFFPGGKNWAGARPPPPGQPGFSSGLQVRHGLAGQAGSTATLAAHFAIPSLPAAAAAAVVCLAASRQPASPGQQRSLHTSSPFLPLHCPPPAPSPLQVVVHNLPWDCTWQQLKDAFNDCGEIERADVVFDSRGRSRCAACLPACACCWPCAADACTGVLRCLCWQPVGPDVPAAHPACLPADRSLLHPLQHTDGLPHSHALLPSFLLPACLPAACRGFGIVRFPDKESADIAVNTMNNATIGGRVVSVRIDRFA